MRLLRRLLDKQAKMFEPGGRFHRLWPLFEAGDTFYFEPGTRAEHAPFVRDGMDSKRYMSFVIIALIPCVCMALYNTGLQANEAIALQGFQPHDTWRDALMRWAGLGYNPRSMISCLAHGALWFLPIMIVTYVVGGLWEVLFAVVRGHPINEGFLVTGLLFPLIMPPNLPLWQVAVGISFGVVLGKEVFGGTGYNILNPALTGRAFLFFGYPSQFSGNEPYAAVDGFTGATPLTTLGDGGMGALEAQDGLLLDSFLGIIPGSMGETSTAACLIGAAFLLLTRTASWRVMLSLTTGSILTILMFNAIGSDTNPAFAMPFWWHLCVGSWAFGTVFMATDPVSGPASMTGRYIYGFFIGVMIILIRVVNPAFYEGVLLAILLANVFAPLIDHYVLKAHLRRRRARYA